ncbi:MAG: TetR/AcrR family transcriptional repressor of nem operon [Planctomycetota bacterium]|jgi:TetR/AcrR family transcriptional repressor of nem operon
MTGRPRHFDEGEVLTRAMDLFWKKGYEATGLRDLIEEMEIGRQSLYSTFGDKRQLFLRALEHYLASSFEEIRTELQKAKGPVDALQRWLDLRVLGLCSAGDGARGCMGLNTIVELCPDDTEVANLMRGHAQLMVGQIADVIAQGQASGVFRTDHGPAELAHYLMMGAAGLLVSSKLLMPPELGQGTVAMLVDSIRKAGQAPV